MCHLRDIYKDKLIYAEKLMPGAYRSSFRFMSGEPELSV